jgi:hypothetical protein
MSKGDWQRKPQVPMKDVDNNWDRIFGKNKKSTEDKSVKEEPTENLDQKSS